MEPALPASPPPPPIVRQLRQVLLWPLRLMPLPPGTATRPWELLAPPGRPTVWREVIDEFTGSADDFHERHYNEFVTFLPYVQRFLYGEGRAGRQARAAGSPMRVFRRRDVARIRVEPHPGDEPLELEVVHIDLYFFLAIDVVLLNVEWRCADLPLARAQDLLYRFGRAYPAGWDAAGNAQHCMARVEFVDAAGTVLARSDAQDRDAFLAHVSEHRAPRFVAHWAFVLEPLISDHSGGSGALRFRQIEYYRMPTMAWLALDAPQRLTRNDFVRLGLVTAAAEGGGDAALPFAEPQLADFERAHCYDRFWSDAGAAPHTRYLVSGHSLVVVGDAAAAFFVDEERGVLAQFRHQHFLLFLIAHFQKAALLMFSDRLAEALKHLDLADTDSIRRFKRTIRECFANFLVFTHRYWFHEISEQAQARALFRLCTTHLGIDPLYAEVKERIADMAGYLETDSLRRQANTVVRLTVVTIFGLIGTVTTGFLGMNLFAEADAPPARRLALFGIVFVATAALTVYTMVKSKRLSDFLDALSDERLGAWAKARALAGVWRRERP
ncbi:MAG: hypothetical protein J0L57_20635 [Burkholderiales bacterium]|nr:hypothetical protein [Burkholderiales bacterium]